jgi:TnpA family transposase
MKGGDRENAARNLEKALRFVSGEKEREKIQSLLNRLESVPKSPEPLK